MSKLIELDHYLFHLINRDLSHPYLDLFFPFWTDFQKNPLFTFGLVPLLLGVIIWKKNWRLLKVILLMAAGAFLADFINAEWIKPVFERVRPSEMILRIPHQGSFSFPSSHSVDAFFMASFLGFYYPRVRTIFFGIASLTAFSRIYCGVHYPADILAGALVGTLLAYIGYHLTKFILRKT